MYQKGGAGIPIVIAVVGGLVVLYAGFSLVGSLGNNEIEDEPAQQVIAGDTTVAQTTEPEKSQSYVVFDNNFYTSDNRLFMRFGGSGDYVEVHVEDLSTFRRVSTLGGSSESSPGFYLDSKNVYFFSGSGLTKVEGADPNSFQQLNGEYAKDSNQVYIVTTTCATNGTCTGQLTVVPGADPGTFQPHFPTEVPNPNGPGTVTVDSQDQFHQYDNGVTITTLPDPDDHSLHPGDDNPVLISP